MHPGVVSRAPDTPVAELARTMADLRMHCIAVAGVARRDDGDEHLVWGLVSDMDVVHAAYRGQLASPASELAAAAPLAPARERRPRSRGRADGRARAPRTSSPSAARGMPSGVVSTLDVLRIVAAG